MTRKDDVDKLDDDEWMRKYHPSGNAVGIPLLILFLIILGAVVLVILK